MSNKKLAKINAAKAAFKVQSSANRSTIPWFERPTIAGRFHVLRRQISVEIALKLAAIRQAELVRDNGQKAIAETTISTWGHVAIIPTAPFSLSETEAVHRANRASETSAMETLAASRLGY